MLDARSRWRSVAACQSCDPELFFPLSSSGPAVEQIARAKEICAGCPVRRECLAFALRTRQAHGVWGGLTEQERYLAWSNRPCWTTPGVPDTRAASAARSSAGPS